jgi:hypothetical protein
MERDWDMEAQIRDYSYTGRWQTGAIEYTVRTPKSILKGFARKAPKKIGREIKRGLFDRKCK